MNTGDRSIGDVLQDIVHNIQDILRSEIRLAKTEVREEAVKAKGGSVLLGGGAVAGLFASFFLLMAAVYGLSRIMPDWAAALVVAVVLGIAGAVALSAGVKKLKQVHPKPEKTVESIKENVEWLKHQTR
jgi:cytochrome c biogenesis protein CcdA